MQRKDSLNTLVRHDAANGDGGVDATALHGDQYALIDLHTFFIAFNNADVHVERVAHTEVGEVALELCFGHAFDEMLLVHDGSRCGP